MAIILGIETSCDETAVALVSYDEKGRGEILSHVVFSQIATHAPYGGVVPELAARAHIERLDEIIAQTLREADISFPDIDAVAATAGPGLVGGVMIGLTTAKAIALAHNIPLIPINHLEAHALTIRLEAPIAFPYLLLLISGGHCQLLSVNGLGDYQLYGETRDDAVGEAFDKTAKLLGLGYPGGQIVEAHAKNGDAHRFPLPRPLANNAGCDFSFSGLKTALRQTAEKQAPLHEQDIHDLCASLQAAIIDILCERSTNAMQRFRDDHPHVQNPAFVPAFVIAGGVAANQALRDALITISQTHNYSFHAAAPALCTDNGAMVAWAGAEYFAAGKIGDTESMLSLSARARWPL